jgi:branched-chain amino acid transport system substrate-binding protein
MIHASESFDRRIMVLNTIKTIIVKKIASLLVVTLLTLMVVTPALAYDEPGITSIKIGNISMNAVTDLPGQQVLGKMACDDINSYFASHKLPFHIEVEFKVASNPSTHLDRVKEFQAEGIKLLLAGRWNSCAAYALPYINQNKILILSPSSTDPALALKNDNLFRLCPDDSYLGTALAHAVKTKVDKVVIIQRDDNWGWGVNSYFSNVYQSLGGQVLNTHAYDPYHPDYESCIIKALNDINGDYSNTGVVIFAYNEAADILNLAETSHPDILSCKWYGADGTGNNQYIVNNAGAAASTVGLYSILPVGQGPNWASVKSRYETATGQIFTAYTAYEYDIYWVYALSAVKVECTNPSAIKAVLPSVAANYLGVSGYYVLNQYGDRFNFSFDIWGYKSVSGTVQSVKVGSVDTSNNVMWV